MEDFENWGDEDSLEKEDVFQLAPLEEEDYGSDEGADVEKGIGGIFEEGKANGKDILKFAKRILVWIACIFLVFSIINIFCPSEEAKTVWNFSATAFNSLTSIVIGYYFAKKE